MAADWAALNGADDDDTALRRAIAMSLAQPPQGPPPCVQTKQQATSTSMSALGLDRKKMEEERLARTRKRKAEAQAGTTLAPTLADAYLHAESHALQAPPFQRPKLQSTQWTGPSGLNTEPRAQGRAGVPKARSHGPLQYPQGVVLRTWARGSPRDDDITIEEVFQKDELDLAVLSSWQWNEDWLFSKLDMTRTKVLLIAFANDDAQKAQIRDNAPQHAVRFVFPSMPSVASTGCMHSKLQLLKFKKSLRIVVPTGNLVAYDWGETGEMENMVFLIDLPLIEDSSKQRDKDYLTPFGQELFYFLKAQGMEDKMIASLRKYDFSETAQYGFIHTIAGSHVQPDLWQRTGYCGLGRAVTVLGLASAQNVELDYICSSVGAVKLELLAALYNACQGDSGMKEYEARTAKSRKTKGASAATAKDGVDLARIRVYFPSRETVLQSRGGVNSAGTICFRSRYWDAPTFPRQVLRDGTNVRPGVLMHSKMLFVRPESGSRGWAYVGSANLSESAWGRMVRDGSSGKPKLNARNWECGVLVPAIPSSGDCVEGKATHGAAGELDLFRGSVPVPIQFPALSYEGSGRRPWLLDEA